MAYVFNRVNNFYGKKQDEESGGVGTDATKSTSPNASVGSNRSPNDFTRTSGSNDFGAVVERNRGVTQAAVGNSVLNPARQEAKGIKGALKKSGDDYLGGVEKDLPTAPTTEDYNKFQGGDSEVGSRLQKLYSGPPTQVKSYVAPTMDDKIDAATFNQQGDLSSYLQKERGGNYTKGMGALDDLLFRQSDEGRNVGAELQKLQADVDDTKKSMVGAEGLTKQAQTKADERAKQIKTNIGDEVQKRSAAIRANPNVTRARQDRGNLQPQLDYAVAESGLTPEQYDAAIIMGLFNPAEFEKPLSQQTNATYTPEQMQQFERLMGLIGGKDTLQNQDNVDTVMYDTPRLRDKLAQIREQIPRMKPEDVPSPGRLVSTGIDASQPMVTRGTSQPVQKVISDNAMAAELANIYGSGLGSFLNDVQKNSYVGMGYSPGFY